MAFDEGNSRQAHSISSAALALFLALIFACRPLDDHDIFTQIALGRLILERGSLLVSEPFFPMYSNPDWVNPGWLWQVLAALVVDTTSLSGLKLLHSGFLTAAVLLALTAVSSTAHARMKNSGTLAAIVFCLLPLLSSTSVRPQIIAFLCFSAVYHLLMRTPQSGWRDVLIVALCMLWQNCHMSVAVVFPLLLLVGPGTGLFSCITTARVILIIACAATTFATPLGLSAFTFAADNYEISKELFQITEWYALFELPLSFLPMFWVSLGVLLPIAVWHRQELDLKDIALWGIFILATVFAVRFVAFWALVTLPIARRLFGQMTAPWWPEIIWQRSGRMFRLGSSFVILLATASCVLQTPVTGPAIEGECAATLPPLPAGSTVFTDRRMAGILVFQHGERYSVTADGRLYLYTPDTWREYLAHLFGNAPLKEVLARWQPAAFMLDPRVSSRLVRKLVDSPDWHTTYHSTSCVVLKEKL